MDNNKQKAAYDRQMLEGRRLLLHTLVAGQSSRPMRQQGRHYGETKQGEGSQPGPEA